jgi:hypothetical protein
MRLFQKISVIAVAASALLIALGTMLASSYWFDPASWTHDSHISLEANTAIENFNLQTADDTTIYQQQVSALWANKDLLKVVADQQAVTQGALSENLFQNAELGRIQNVTNVLLSVLIGLVALVAFRTFGPAKKSPQAELVDKE